MVEIRHSEQYLKETSNQIKNKWIKKVFLSLAFSFLIIAVYSDSINSITGVKWLSDFLLLTLFAFCVCFGIYKQIIENSIAEDFFLILDIVCFLILVFLFIAFFYLFQKDTGYKGFLCIFILYWGYYLFKKFRNKII